MRKRGALLVLPIVFILSLARDALLLLRYPVAVGADGYYYVLQIQELLNHGYFYFPTHTPLVFYALAALSAFTGNTIFAIKIGSITLHAFLCLGIYALVSTITRNRWLGMLGGAMAALSAMHFYMIAEFIKNLGALALLVWSGWSAIRFSQRRKVQWIVLSIGLLVAAIFSHISILAIAPSLLTLALLLHWFMSKDRSKYHKRAALFIVLILAISPALLAAQKFVELPAWLQRELLAQAKWPISLASPVGRTEMIVLLLAAPLTLFLIARLRQSLPDYYSGFVVGAIALWSLLITLNPFLNHDVRQFGIIGRLDHLMYIQVAILVPGLIWLILHFYRKAVTAALTLTLIFVAASLISALPRGLQPQYLLEREQMIEALPEQRQQLDVNSLVIAQHGDEFVVTWALGIPAQQRWPENAQGRSVYWLLHDVSGEALRPYMIAVMNEGMDSCLALIKQDDLIQWLNTMTRGERERLLGKNLHLKRHLQSNSISELQSPVNGQAWHVVAGESISDRER